jgi:molybdate transport repressor ModE-like protein
VPNNWSGLDLHHLEVLQAIAEKRTFWAASESLDVSPSAVSQALGTMEKIVGHRLVERSRGRRQVRLTEAGEVLVRHAGAIVAHLRAAEADFAAFARGASGTLRVGIYQSVGAKIAPRLLRDFGREAPGVQVQMIEESGHYELLRMVERGDLDLTFAMHPLPAGPFESVTLLRDPYVLAVPRDSVLGRSGKLPRPDPGRPAMLDVIDGSCDPLNGNPANGYLRSRGVELRTVFETADNLTVQAMVAAGHGVALVPLLTVDERDTSIRLIRLDDCPPRLVALAWHRDRYRHPAVAAFVDCASRICSDVEAAATSTQEERSA